MLDVVADLISQWREFHYQFVAYKDIQSIKLSKKNVILTLVWLCELHGYTCKRGYNYNKGKGQEYISLVLWFAGSLNIIFSKPHIFSS